MRFTVENMVSFYMFICVALLVFNTAYIFRARSREEAHRRRALQWRDKITAELERLRRGDPVSGAHRALLKLRRLGELTDHYAAMEPLLGGPFVQAYLDDMLLPFQSLAAQYCRRPPAERAFFAYVISCFRPGSGEEGGQLPALLLQFLDGSTVYCRQNVLLALCALGDGRAVERALARFQAEGWYHHARLLSDGLTTFNGDREALARRLWAVSAEEWGEELQVAVVQFAANLPADCSDIFLPALTDRETPEETRFALIRYFQRHPDIEAREPLLELAVGGGAEGGPAIAACAALAQYPGEDTRRVLLTALRSRNWYVRRNAAASLAALGVEEADLEGLRDDRYAREMLAYMAAPEEREAVGV